MPGWPSEELPWDTSRPLSEWIEHHVVLPVGRVQDAGPIKLHSYQKGIADAIGDDFIERISLIKSVRTGFTTLLNACVAYYAKEKACNILVVVPTNSDSRDYIVSELEPMFECSPKLRNVLPEIRNTVTNRATMLYRPFPGGSLRIVSARSPRNLRRHSSRVILCDEVDAFSVFGGGISKSEGDSIALAERRSLSFSPRKLISGSTPLETDTSIILRLYSRSDMRVFEIPCVHCGKYFELLWKDIHWERNDPETAHAICPCCGSLILEEDKAKMVSWGRWRATRPEVKNHAGFRLNALISPMVNARWSVLVAEYLHCRDKPDLLKVFTTTLLGQSWDSVQGSEFTEDILQARAEDFSLANIPREIISLTCGVDVQGDRLEVTTCGWSRDNICYVLDHHVFFGDINVEPELLIELDDFLKTTYPHPGGGRLKVDVTLVDCSDGKTIAAVMKFTGPRTHRKVLAGKGAGGFQRQPLARNTGTTKIKFGRNFRIIGVDVCKAIIFDKLAKGNTIRFSNTLSDEYYFQLCSEKRMIRLSRGRPVPRFEQIAGRRNETLDCLVYAFAAHTVVQLNLDEREDNLNRPVPVPPKPAPTVFKSRFMEAGRV